MTEVVRTPTAEWRQRDDGSWEAVPHVGQRQRPGGGGPGPGGSFGPEDVQGGDNIIVTELPDGVLIERGGHMVLFGGVPTTWRRNLDFHGPGVLVADDPINSRTVVEIGAAGTLVWRGDWDAGEFYTTGDVVSFGDGLFVFSGAPQGAGFGLGGFGSGPFGGEGAVSGFGGFDFGAGPFGG